MIVREYYRGQWISDESTSSRWNESSMMYSLDEVNQWMKDLIESWKYTNVKFRIIHIKIEHTENKKVTTESYINLDNPYYHKGEK
jgi:hypothetical protein